MYIQLKNEIIDVSKFVMVKKCNSSKDCDGWVFPEEDDKSRILFIVANKSDRNILLEFPDDLLANSVLEKIIEHLGQSDVVLDCSKHDIRLYY